MRAEQLLPDIVSQYRYARLAEVIFIGNKSATIHRHCADFCIQCLNAKHTKGAAVELTGYADSALELSYRHLDPETLRANITHIIIIELDASACALAAGLILSSALEYDDKVVADLPHILALTFLETVTHGYNQHDRGDAPGNSRHCQEAAQLIAQETGKNMTEEFFEEYHWMYLMEFEIENRIVLISNFESRILLQNYLLTFGEAFHDLHFRSIADACGYRYTLLAFLIGGVRNINFG
jgi:hypothetical protein